MSDLFVELYQREEDEAAAMRESENMDEEIDCWITKCLRTESRQAKRKAKKENVTKKERKRKHQEERALREAAYSDQGNISKKVEALFDDLPTREDERLKEE